MELQEAVVVVKKLAKGINPISEKPIEEDSAYNNPRVIRSLYTLIDHLPKQKKTAEEKREQNKLKGIPLNSGLPWSDEERDRVARAFKERKKLAAIASEVERTEVAIVAELERQGVISEREAAKHGFVKRPFNGNGA